MKVMNSTELWDVDLTQDSPSATHQICLNGFKFASMVHNLRIHCLRLSWPCLIIKVLATQAKFLEPSDYCTVINYAFTFCLINDFGCFSSIMAQFELIRKSCQIRLGCTFICVNFKFHSEWSTLDTTILPSAYFSQLELLQSLDLDATN